MARTGPKNKPDHLKAVAGTKRSDRETIQIYPDLAGEVLLPDAFEELREERPKDATRLLRIWNRKLAIYAARGQSCVGYEAALYVYCGLEFLIQEALRSGEIPPGHVTGQHRLYGAEFHDTPAGNLVTGKGKGGNPFDKNGKPGA